MDNKLPKLYILVITFSLLLSPIAFARAHHKKHTSHHQKHITKTHIPLIEQKEVKKFMRLMEHKYHFKYSYLQYIFRRVKIKQEILDKMNHPYEAMPWFEYQQHFITPARIDHGVKFWNKHAKTLARAQKEYGVPASVIVAIIGVESNYGKNTGDFHVINALSTIAFKYKLRSAYFTKELEQFFLLCREKHLNPLTVRGSYAGAIGQPQFMPSNFREYAVAFSNSGKIDLSHNIKDVIGSVANFFKAHGWKQGKNVALKIKVKRPRYRYYNKYLFDVHHEPNVNLSQLTPYIINPVQKLSPKTPASIIKLKGRKGPIYWLGFHNIYVITHYNTNIHYAMAVYQLSLAIKKAREKTLQPKHHVTKHHVTKHRTKRHKK